MNIYDYSSPLLAIVSTILVGLASGFVPLVNIELYVIFMGTVAPRPLLPLLLLLATVFHMAGKSAVYAAGRSLDRIPSGRFKRRLEAAHAKLEKRQDLGATVIFASSLIGLPPFYAITVLSGVVRFNFLHYVLAGFLGRLLRFAALMLLPYFATG